jgi:hypothetical protein
MEGKREVGNSARPLGNVPGDARRHSKAGDNLSNLSATAPTSGRRFDSSSFKRFSQGVNLSNLQAANMKPADPHKGAGLSQVSLQHNERNIADKGMRSLLTTQARIHQTRRSSW